MSLGIPTLDQLISAHRAIWQALRPSADLERGADGWLMVHLSAKIGYRLHQTIERAVRALHPRTTWGIYLDWWLYCTGCSDGSGGYGRIIARGSTGTDAIRVTATGAGAVSVGDQLTDTEGKRYQLTESHAFTGAGTYDLDIAAIDTGYDTNLETGAVLTFVSPPANISSTATLVADLDGGCDEETDAEGRLRLLERLRNPSLSANPAQVRQVVNDVSTGALRAYCYPSRQNAPFGFGTMDVAALQVNESSNDRIITAAQGTLITDAVEAQLPESIWRNWRLLTVAARTQGGMSPPGYQPTSVALKYTLKPSASGESVADFDSGTLAATVSSHDENTLKVTASKSVAGVIAAGDRIVTCEAGVVTEGTVASVSSADIFLTDWPWDTGDGPTAGLQLQAGGGLTTDIRQAAIDLMDTLGPGKASSGSIDQSDPTDDGWDDTLRILRVQQAALECSDDLLDIDVTDLGGAGASDLTPTASATSTVYLITAGEIVVTEDAGDFS